MNVCDTDVHTAVICSGSIVVSGHSAKRKVMTFNIIREVIANIVMLTCKDCNRCCISSDPGFAQLHT